MTEATVVLLTVPQNLSRQLPGAAVSTPFHRWGKRKARKGKNTITPRLASLPTPETVASQEGKSLVSLSFGMESWLHQQS